jgi:DNA polymerase-3 subunit delta'
MRFADVLDQHHAIGMLRSALRGRRVHHAYIFAGPAGTGRSETAAAFAQALQCERYREDACGECDACRRASAGTHPDIRWIEPAAGKQSVGIDQIRDVRREAAYGPYEAGTKVFVVRPAETMLAEAQNSLLKLLEEPPPRVVFVLIAESPQSLLPTVVSRCQLVRFNLVPTRQIEHALRVQYDIEPARARVLAALSGGRVARAAEWARQPDALADRDNVVSLMLRAEREGLLGMLEASESLAKEKGRLADLLDIALLWYRDLIVWKEVEDETLLVNLDRKDEIADLGSRMDVAALRRRVASIEEAKAALRRNVNARLALEAMFLRFELTEEPAGRV